MRGFSLFAPIVGFLLLVAAMAVSATVSSHERTAVETVSSFLTSIKDFPVAEAVRNDMFTSFVASLRTYFYDFHVYTPEFLQSPRMDKIAEDWFRDFSSGMMNMRAYTDRGWVDISVEGDNARWEALRDQMFIEPMGDKLVVTFDVADVLSIPEYNVSYEDGSVKVPLLPRGKMVVPVYFPVEEVREEVERIVGELKNSGLMYGWCGYANPVIRDSKGNEYCSSGTCAHSFSDGTFVSPCAGAKTVRFGEHMMLNAWTDVERWVKYRIEKVLKKHDALKNWSVEEVSFKTEKADVDYARLFCITGNLNLKNLVNVDEGDLVCAVIHGDGAATDWVDGSLACWKIKEIDITLSTSSHGGADTMCYPGGVKKIRIRVKTQVTGHDAFSGGKIDKKDVTVAADSFKGTATWSCHTSEETESTYEEPPPCVCSDDGSHAGACKDEAINECARALGGGKIAREACTKARGPFPVGPIREGQVCKLTCYISKRDVWDALKSVLMNKCKDECEKEGGGEGCSAVCSSDDWRRIKIEGDAIASVTTISGGGTVQKVCSAGGIGIPK